MTNSKQLAGLIGPTLIALSISEAINLRTLADLGSTFRSLQQGSYRFYRDPRLAARFVERMFSAAAIVNS